MPQAFSLIRIYLSPSDTPCRLIEVSAAIYLFFFVDVWHANSIFSFSSAFQLILKCFRLTWKHYLLLDWKNELRVLGVGRWMGLTLHWISETQLEFSLASGCLLSGCLAEKVIFGNPGVFLFGVLASSFRATKGRWWWKLCIFPHSSYKMQISWGYTTISMHWNSPHIYFILFFFSPETTLL